MNFRLIDSDGNAVDPGSLPTVPPGSTDPILTAGTLVGVEVHEVMSPFPGYLTTLVIRVD